MATIKAVIRLRCPAGVAKPGPAIGQALGPHGLNMMEFVKEFNARTQKLEPNTPIPVVLTAYANRTFAFVTKTPPTTYLVRNALGLDKGSSTPGSVTVGAINAAQVADIATVKITDPHLAHIPFESICESVKGTALSMGIDFDDGTGADDDDEEDDEEEDDDGEDDGDADDAGRT